MISSGGLLARGAGHFWCVFKKLKLKYWHVYLNFITHCYKYTAVFSTVLSYFRMWQIIVVDHVQYFPKSLLKFWIVHVMWIEIHLWISGKTWQVHFNISHTLQFNKNYVPSVTEIDSGWENYTFYQNTKIYLYIWMILHDYGWVTDKWI